MRQPPATLCPTDLDTALADSGFVTGDVSMAPVLERLMRVGAVDTTVLLSGYSGTGKEVAARVLHRLHAARRDGPWVAVNCGALSSGLVESELFGHVKGAFTGADRDHAGCFERADGGTLFLDEVGTMSPEHQVRLLRVLQERQVLRVGGRRAIPVNVRVIAATNEDLMALVEAGRFRRDLFYRLNVFPITLPPLRDRGSDVTTLATHSLDAICKRLRVPRLQFTESGLAAMAGHPWPGNAREMENAVEYAVLMAAGQSLITPLHLPPGIVAASGSPAAWETGTPALPEAGLDLRQAVTHLERSLILESLRRSNGNKARAAELLHLKRTTLVEKMKRLPDLDALPVS